MSANLIPFAYQDQPVRVVEIDGEPWFVLADLCGVLDIANPSMVATRLDPLTLSQTEVQNSRGQMRLTVIVSEPGMYEVVIRSDKPEATTFRRWITTEVLPSIRKTGSYGVQQLTGPELMAAALIEARETLDRQRREVLILTPKADAWDAFLASTGDYSVNEAAKILGRDKGVQTGEVRLRKLLIEWGWIYRQSGAPRAMQRQIDLGRMAEKASFHYHPQTGEKVADTPQVRITPKGVDAIWKRMTSILAA